jgi:sucrose-6-phosphate hydrolase SacC (GH32 family)
MRFHLPVCALLLLFAGPLADAQAPVPGAVRFNEPLRPQIHFTPPANFMNDPNGLVFFEGEYHLFYQHNPFGNRWGHMSWGHAVSRDLLHWEHLPVALREEDGIMIFSGSAVVDRTDSSGLCGGHSCLVAIYTGQTEKKQTQNLAYSTDRGRTWTKYAGNPVVDLGMKDFRDPKVFWHEDTKRWVMVTVLPDQHKVRFFGSRDLKRWEALSDFGPAGATGGVWECPDLFPLPVEGAAGETRWVLDVDLNPGGVAGGSGGQYFVGRFDGRTFVNDAPASETSWSDYGRDFYATISFSDIPAADGRRIWMAWMSNWIYANEEPTSPWRGALSLPRELRLRQTPAGLRLVQRPVRELDTLRIGGTPVRVAASTPLPAAAADIALEVAATGGEDAGIRLSNDSGEEVVIGAGGSPLEVFVDRRRSRATPLANYPGRHAGPVRAVDGGVQLRVIVDRSMVEVFANDGETAVSDRLFPTQPYTRIEPVNGARLRKPAEMWPLRRVWRER